MPLVNEKGVCIDWPEFQMRFDGLYSGLCKKLLKKAPKLTTSEIKALMSARVKMGVGQSADFLNITESAISNLRSRARKKLRLKRKTDLPQWLEGL